MSGHFLKVPFIPPLLPFLPRIALWQTFLSWPAALDSYHKAFFFIILNDFVYPLREPFHSQDP